MKFWDVTPWALKQRLCDVVPYVDIHDIQLCVRDLWDGDRWRFDLLSTPLLDDVAHTIDHYYASLFGAIHPGYMGLAPRHQWHLFC